MNRGVSSGVVNEWLCSCSSFDKKKLSCPVWKKNKGHVRLLYIHDGFHGKWMSKSVRGEMGFTKLKKTRLWKSLWGKMGQVRISEKANFQTCLGGNGACQPEHCWKNEIPNLVGRKWGVYRSQKKRMSPSAGVEMGHVRIPQKKNFQMYLGGNWACRISEKVPCLICLGENGTSPDLRKS